MFLGRVGSLTVVVALAQAKPKLDVRYPEETVLIG
jgi:Trk-type K+ transport system membrane component